MRHTIILFILERHAFIEPFLKIFFSIYKRCQLPVCDEMCEKGDLHKLECDVFYAVLNYHNTNVTKIEKEEEPGRENDVYVNKDEVEHLLKTFNVSKFESPCPIYASITPLRMLLKCRQDMTKETLKLQTGENTKDEIDVSKCSNKQFTARKYYHKI